ncbi:unnamed protein product [Ixodes persulcatus]
MLEMPKGQVGICVPKTAKGQSEREDNVSSRQRRVGESAVPVDVSSQAERTQKVKRTNERGFSQLQTNWGIWPCGGKARQKPCRTKYAGQQKNKCSQQKKRLRKQSPA